MKLDITYACPECGSTEYLNENLIGEGFRECAKCGQEWWTEVNYTKKEVKTMAVLLYKKIEKRS